MTVENNYVYVFQSPRHYRWENQPLDTENETKTKICRPFLSGRFRFCHVFWFPDKAPRKRRLVFLGTVLARESLPEPMSIPPYSLVGTSVLHTCHCIRSIATPISKLEPKPWAFLCATFILACTVYPFVCAQSLFKLSLNLFGKS